MKTLSLLRHAKARRDIPGIEDFERPLAPQGREAASMMGRHLRQAGLRPDLVLCSPALRTRQTAELALAALGEPLPRISFVPEIYEAEPARLLEVLRGAEGTAGHVLMIGHNPGFQELALVLAGSSMAGGDAALVEKFPTGALAVLELPVESWAEAAPGIARLRSFVTPRSLGQLRDDA